MLARLSVKPLTIGSVVMLTVLAAGFGAPSASAVTVYSLNVTVTVDGQTATTTLKAVDSNDDGVIQLDVSDSTLGQIQGAFGTGEFVFPGSYTGTFDATFHGRTVTTTVTLQSDDTFILRFV